MKQRSKGQVLATRARKAFDEGALDEARKLARRALDEAANDPSALRSLSELAAAMGNVDVACELLEQSLVRHPPPAPVSWQVRLGDLRVRQGKLDDGVRAYQAVVSRAPNERAGWVGLATAREAQRNGFAAIESWQRASDLDPNDWETALRLAEALMEIRAWDRADEAFAKASRGNAQRPSVMVGRGTLDMHRGLCLEAMARFKACVAQHPSYAPGHAALGILLREEGRFEEAAGALRRAKELVPDDPNHPLVLGRILLEGGLPERALAEARAYLARRPGHCGALALEALAHIALGDADDVARFFDYPTVVLARRLPVPRGFADLASFNAVLAAHAANHPTLMTAPASHSTYQGLHSGSLLVEPRGPVAPFEEAIESVVAGYWRRLSQATHLPFAESRPHDVVLAMWCIVLERGAHQGPHIHPAAWLSGVYYPQIPEGIRTGAGPEGWLEFGKPDGAFPSKTEPPLYRVRPEEGLVVVFPSYIYHRTLPFEDSGTRISVAFDVVPFAPASERASPR